MHVYKISINLFMGKYIAKRLSEIILVLNCQLRRFISNHAFHPIKDGVTQTVTSYLRTVVLYYGICFEVTSQFCYNVLILSYLQGFFRRSIQKQIEYRCLRDGKCMVIRLNRNRCQYCRFKKCLAVGMSRDCKYDQ